MSFYLSVTLFVVKSVVKYFKVCWNQKFVTSWVLLIYAKSRSSFNGKFEVFCSTLKAYLQNHKSFMREDFTTLWEWIARHYSRAVQRHYCFVLIIAIIDVVPWWRSEIWWMNEAHFDLVWCYVHFKFQKKRLNLETFQFPSVFPSFFTGGTP